MAEELRKEQNVTVMMESGGLGELSVTADGEKIYDTNRLLYPRPSKIVQKVRSRLTPRS